MKDVFKVVEIEPNDVHLDFFGPIKPSEPGCILQGTIRLELAKPVKIRGISVKFKGFSCVTLNKTQTDMEILPKLKSPLMERNTLNKGKHILPWELTIPNAYPQSIMAKRSIIHYKVELNITLGLSKTVTAEYPIVLRRHLLPRKELAPCVETKVYQHTIPTKFHYAIEAPQIACLEQGSLPFAIKYLCIANQKSVRSIRTQLIQVELYRCQPISKSGTEKSRDDTDIYQLVRKVEEKGASREYTKYIKRTVPALIHSVDASRSSDWKRPLVIRHPLHQHLSSVLDSPLVTIHHQLEITFQFDHKFEEVKAKIPLIITTVPPMSGDEALPPAESKYAFETGPRYDCLRVVAEAREDGDSKGLPRRSDDGTRTTTSSYFEQSDLPPPAPDVAPPRHPGAGSYAIENSLRPSVSDMDLLQFDPSSSNGTSNLKKSVSAFDIGPFSSDSDGSKETSSYQREQEQQLRQQQQYQSQIQQRQQRKPQKPSPIAAPLAIDIHLANGARSSPRQQRNIHRTTGEVADRHGSSRSNSRNAHSHNDEGLSIYSDTSLSLSSSVTASSNKSNTILQSRPPSPVFSPAPGLPATIPLQPHEDRPVALVEESFINTPNSVTTADTSPFVTPRTSSMRRGRFTLSMNSLMHDTASIMNDTASFCSGRESTLDPDVNDMEDEPISGAHRFMNAKLPPLPTHASQYEHDGASEIMGPLPPIPERFSNPQESESLKPDRPTLPRLSFGMPLAESWRLAERQ